MNLHMTSLKPLRVATNEAPKAKKSSIQIIEVGGDLVSRFCAAAVALKTATANSETLSAEVKSVGLPQLYQVAIENPGTPPSSIKLQDKNGSTVLVTCQNRYSEFDPEVASPIFEELGAEITDHAQYVVKAKFDDKVFLAQAGTDAGEEGKFSPKIYNAYKAAIDRATAQLVRDGLLPAGTVAPLSSYQAACVLPSFHAKRWAAFPEVAQQQRLAEVISATVSLKPVIEGDAEEASKKK